LLDIRQNAIRSAGRIKIEVDVATSLAEGDLSARLTSTFLLSKPSLLTSRKPFFLKHSDLKERQHGKERS
jgi:hypothetical protein